MLKIIYKIINFIKVKKKYKQKIIKMNLLMIFLILKMINYKNIMINQQLKNLLIMTNLYSQNMKIMIKKVIFLKILNKLMQLLII